MCGECADMVVSSFTCLIGNHVVLQLVEGINIEVCGLVCLALVLILVFVGFWVFFFNLN